MNIDILNDLIEGYRLVEQKLTLDNETQRAVVVLEYEKTSPSLLAQLKRSQVDAVYEQQ